MALNPSVEEEYFQRKLTVLLTWATRAEEMLAKGPLFDLALWQRFQQELDPTTVKQIVQRLQWAETAHRSILDSLSQAGTVERRAVMWFESLYITMEDRPGAREGWKIVTCACGWSTSAAENLAEDESYEHARKHMTPEGYTP